MYSPYLFQHQVYNIFIYIILRFNVGPFIKIVNIKMINNLKVSICKIIWTCTNMFEKNVYLPLSSQTIGETTTLAHVKRKYCKIKKSSNTILKYIMWLSYKYANINTTLIYLMTWDRPEIIHLCIHHIIF